MLVECAKRDTSWEHRLLPIAETVVANFYDDPPKTLEALIECALWGQRMILMCIIIIRLVFPSRSGCFLPSLPFRISSRSSNGCLRGRSAWMMMMPIPQTLDGSIICKTKGLHSKKSFVVMVFVVTICQLSSVTFPLVAGDELTIDLWAQP